MNPPPTNKLREAAIKILGMFEPVEPCQHTESQIEQIESILREVVDEAETQFIVDLAKDRMTEKIRRTARAEAIEEFKKICDDEIKLSMALGCEEGWIDAVSSIKLKLRALKP